MNDGRGCGRVGSVKRARHSTARPVPRRTVALAGDPLWYKDAIFYELRVGAFQDSDGDGIGDFPGLTRRLDYLQDLGVTALWLLPFYPSPFRDDGYDISDYENVHPDSGTLDDFRAFLREAHRRGLRVVTELVLNHTSDRHPWFQRARRSPPGSRWRDFYVWSDSPERYSEARIIFKDFEPSNWTWDPVAKAYFWHRFYSHQPDLNFDSPDVRRAALRLLDFWLDLGVDGLRLDAVAYLFEREGTSCENLPETHAFLREMRRHVGERYEHRMLLAEANQWPEDAISYFGQGDECHMAFHFPLMPRLFMALHMEDRFPIIDILGQTPEVPESCQWALFLRNHDELTLETVTDEERDYMYRVYAHDARARINLGIRRRLAPLLGNDRRRVELMNALLFSLPGTPIIYYGDEIGMGDNIYLGDRNGVRTPMQWSSDRNAGFSDANPQGLYLPVIIDPEYHYGSINVEAQQNNLHSLLLWMKRLIALRKRHKPFGRGRIEFLTPSNRKVLAFIRHHQEERILVVANLSRFVEYVELDLSAWKGMGVVELFGHRALPPIGEHPYLLTLGPHSFYWFELVAGEARPGTHAAVRGGQLSPVRVEGDWERALRPEARTALDAALAATLAARRHRGGEVRAVKTAKIVDAIAVPDAESSGYVVLLRVDLGQGGSEIHAVPLLFATDGRAADLRRDRPHAVLAELEVATRQGVRSGVLFDALEDAAFCGNLLTALTRRRTLRGFGGEIVGTTTKALAALRGPADTPLPPSLLPVEQSNTSVRYGDRLLLKLFRRVAAGVNPELEVGRFLTERTSFIHIARVGGALEYRQARRESMTLAVLQAFVPNEGDAWRYTLDQIGQYFERAVVRRETAEEVPVPRRRLLELTEETPPPLLGEMLGGDVEAARLLGRRVAELHRALASDPDDPSFSPEPFGRPYQRALYQSLRTLVARTFHLLRERVGHLPREASADASRLVPREGEVLDACRSLLGPTLSGMRIRCHGDLNLKQLLYTGSDFAVIDFEGDGARAFGERRLKRSPLRDVAGILRSFDHAAHEPLYGSGGEGILRIEDLPRLEPWARFWRTWMSSAFLRAYLHEMSQTGLVPRARAELDTLLRVLLLERTVDELGFELDHRPARVRFAVRGILDLLTEAG